jgi:hypothetical protein
MDSQTAMPPGIRPGELPPFHRLDEYTFQYLCRDLFDAEPSVASCEVYGVRGQGQKGIDLLAHQKEKTAIEVGQCKCYESFPPGEIRQVSDEFFQYWDSHWSKENVKRFILFVACDLSRTKQQDEIMVQKKRFAHLEVRYEAWSAAVIQNRLRSQPGIVASYFSPRDFWVPIICGAAPTTSYDGVYGQTTVTVSVALTNQLEQVSMLLSDEAERRLESWRTACREGRRSETIKDLRDFKHDATRWSALSPEIKGKLLTFEAGLELDVTGDAIRARQLAAEARALAPWEDQTRLEAYLAWRERIRIHVARSRHIIPLN